MAAEATSGSSSASTSSVNHTFQQLEAVNGVLIDAFQSRDTAILKTALLIIAALVNFLGNGLSLVVILKTPKLHTRTFALLFNLTVVDLLTGVMLIWYIVYNVVFVIRSDMCSYLSLIIPMAVIQRYPNYLSVSSASLIAFERYIAIVYPFRYEALVTERNVKISVAFVWVACLALTGSFLNLIGRLDYTTCTVKGLVRQALITDTTCLIAAFVVLIAIYVRIITIAMQQRARISTQMAEIQLANDDGQHNHAAVTTARTKLRGEMKAVRLTASVVGAVVILWTPHVIGAVIMLSGINQLVGQYIADIGAFMGAANSSINWVIYGLASQDFRLSAFKLIGWNRAKVNPDPQTGTTDNTVVNHCV